MFPEPSARAKELHQRLAAFMDEHVYPNEKTYQEQIESGDRWQVSAIMEELKAKARAAFLCCRAVLPAMIRQGGGHIINISPPLDQSMLPGRIAYGISKLGMTLLTFGLAEEVRRHNVAVNSLWPATIIESQASINHQLGTRAMWRKPDILVDCVVRLARMEPAELTGQALVDEDFLRAEGVTDFGGYACVPGSQPPRLSWAALTKN